MKDVKGNEVNVKEALELLKGLEVIAGIAGHIAADGKVNLMDVPKLMPLVAQFDLLTEAFSGLDGLKEEIKDIDQAELVQIIAAAYAVADAFNEGKKK